MFKNDYDLKPVKVLGEQVQGPWILEDINYDLFHSSLGETEKEVVQETFEWSSDNENFEVNKDVVEARPDIYGHIDILGFHPYREILFLCSSSTYESAATGFAYYLRSFKVESLGSMYPRAYYQSDDSESWDIECFPYTPCSWIEKFPEREN
jgi:hypothetical protein